MRAGEEAGSSGAQQRAWPSAGPSRDSSLLAEAGKPYVTCQEKARSLLSLFSLPLRVP